jgi:hypothetical protein
MKVNPLHNSRPCIIRLNDLTLSATVLFRSHLASYLYIWVLILNSALEVLTGTKSTDEKDPLFKMISIKVSNGLLTDIDRVVWLFLLNTMNLFVDQANNICN